MRALWLRLPQGWRYLITGGLNTAVGYGLFALCYAGLDGLLPYALILCVTHVAAVTWSFVTQRHMVFHEHAGHWLPTYIRFQASYLGLLAQGMATNLAMVKGLGWSPWLAQALSMVIGVALAFLVHKFWVFKTPGNAG